MKKKAIVVILSILIVTCALIASGCNATVSDVKLYDIGLEMTTLMQDMLKSMGSLETDTSSSMSNAMANYLANDYDTPIRTYVIEVPSNEVIMEIAMAEYLDKIEAFPDNVREQLCNRTTFTLVLAQITAENTGFYDYSICATYYAEKTIQGTLKKDVAYLYTFETGKPIVVYYHQQAANSIMVSSRFIGNDIYSTLSDTREVFEKYGCDVTIYN